MKIYKINANSNFNELCATIKPQNFGANLMQKKSTLNYFLLRDISSPAANILKQDALSVGAELITNENVILGCKSSDALLMATQKQLEILAKKEALQDFGLKNLAKFISQNFKKPVRAQIMGVINLNNDSFNPASRVNASEAIARIERQISEGAEYIDIGGVSSRPGSEYIGRDGEFARIKETIDEIYRQNLHEKAIFSLDSFDEYCVEYALGRGFGVINDINANLNLGTLAKKYDAIYTLMHKKGDTQTMQNEPKYADLIGEIDEFFVQNLVHLEQMGVKKIFLDVGIGFGKSAADNLFLIKHLEHFLRFEKPLFVGASRKSLIGVYTGESVENRLSGTLFLHLKAFENGAQIIRAHDVKEHKQMFLMQEALDSINIW